MNLVAVRTALSMSKKAYDAFSEYSDRKAREAYDALVEGTHTLEDAYDDANKKASTLTEDARKRLDKAMAEANDRKAAAVKQVKKSRKQLKKEAKAQVKAAKKKLGREQKPSAGARFLQVSAVGAVLAAIAGAVWYFLLREEQVEAAPPKVDDYKDDAPREEESVLVYSTQTPEEGVAERDEELMQSLEEQLGALDLEDEGAEGADETDDAEGEKSASEEK